MDKVSFAALLERIQQEERQVREDGQKEYAYDDNNCFANFEAAALELGGTREEDLMHLALKHWRGICAYVKGHRSQREDVRGRIKDLRMYLALLWAMVEENERKTVIDNAIRRVNDGLEYDFINKPSSVYCQQCGGTGVQMYLIPASPFSEVMIDVTPMGSPACAACQGTGRSDLSILEPSMSPDESLIVCKNCEGPIESNEYERSGLCSSCEGTMNRDLDSVLTGVDT